MRSLKESLLADIEDTIKVGDSLQRNYKKANKDWEKLLKNKNVKSGSGPYCYLKIKSEALANEIFLNCIDEETKKNILNKEITPYIVSIYLNIDDAFIGERKRDLRILVDGSYKNKQVQTLINSNIEYCNYFEDTDIKIIDSINIKDAYNLLLKFAINKLNLNNLDTAIELIKNNISYTIK